MRFDYLESALMDYYECVSTYDDPFFNGCVQGVAFHAYYVVKADTLALVREEYTDEGEWISTLETPLKEDVICQAFDYCTEHGYVVVSYEGKTYKCTGGEMQDVSLPYVMNLFECALEYYENRERVQERIFNELKMKGVSWYVYEPAGLGKGKDLRLLYAENGFVVECSFLRNRWFEDAYEEYCRITTPTCRR